MTINDKLQARIEIAKKHRREADKAEGALEEIRRKIKEDFDCSSLDELIALRKDVEKKYNKAKSSAEVADAEFAKKHGDVLKQLEDDD